MDGTERSAAEGNLDSRVAELHMSVDVKDSLNGHGRISNNRILRSHKTLTLGCTLEVCSIAKTCT